MIQIVLPQLSFSFYRHQPVRADFSGGQITSDAGLLPLRAFDQRHHLTSDLAARLSDPRQDDLFARFWTWLCQRWNANTGATSGTRSICPLICSCTQGSPSGPPLSPTPAEPIPFSNAILFVKGSSQGTQSSGFPTITTGNGCGQNDTFPPCDLIFEGGPSSAGFQLAPCALQDNVTQTCISIVLQLVSFTGKNFSFFLADGEQFCAFGINNTFVLVDAGVQ